LNNSSGVRADGLGIDFCKENRNDTLYSLAEMRQNFQEAIEKHKAIDDILETIPILSQCIHGFDVDLQVRN
jgi:hypothetical protein